MSFGGFKSRSLITPDSFLIDKITIHTVNGESWDISEHVNMVSIYESITRFSLEYEFDIVDSADLFNFMKISGDERITFSITKMGEDGPFTIRKECYISSIPVYGRHKENTQVLKIKGISPHAYIANIKRVSKRFSGSPVFTIKELIEKELNTNVSHFDNNAAGYVRGIIPYMTVAEAIGWLRKRAYDENGFPFFVYETLFDGIHVESYSTLQNHTYTEPFIQGQFITDRPVSWPEGATPKNNSEYGLFFKEQKHRILSMESKLGLSKLKNATQGAYASNTLEVDIHNKSFVQHTYKYDANHTIGKYPLYREDFKVNDLALHEYPDAKRFEVNKNSNLYEKGVTSYNDRIAPFVGRLVSLNETLGSITHILKLAGDVSLHAGTTISINIPRPIDKDLDNRGEFDASENIDPYMSGKYLMIGTEHRFTGDGHNMTVRLQRDSVNTDLTRTAK